LIINTQMSVENVGIWYFPFWAKKKKYINIYYINKLYKSLKMSVGIINFKIGTKRQRHFMFCVGFLVLEIFKILGGKKSLGGLPILLTNCVLPGCVGYFFSIL